ncbi:MAG: Blue-light-activated protein [Myxococcales bacterium]|nr:Blue-light-activated protein [Myxococcales bacterium]
MYRTKEDGRFEYANPALARLLGYSVEELLAKNLNHDIYIDAEDRVRLIEKYRPRGVVDGAAVRWRARDGRQLIVQIWGHAIEKPEGASFDASVLDITELEARNAVLRQQREDLERTATILDLVVRQMPALYWVVDRDLRIQRTGGAVMGVLGYAPEKFIGLTLHDTHSIEPASVSPIVTHEAALRGETVTYDAEYRGKQLAMTIAPYRTDAGIVGAIGTAIDVTASRQLERRIVDTQRAESLGVLAGGLAHDFNNLLVAVLGNADLALREIPPSAPGRAAIENIRDAGLRAAELTDQLLAYAGRGGAGSIRVQPATIVDELLRISAPSLPEHVRVSVELSSDIYLRADPTQVRQVLLNLITNARDAIGSRTGSISIGARHVDCDGHAELDDVITAAAGAYVLIEVSDDGPGMDRETRRHVFEPFFTTKSSGHGLGLAAVLGIVRAHGGGLRLFSAPNQGAKFQVLWPAAAAPPARVSTPAIAAIRTVLVIDDEAIVRDVVARMVEDLGYAAVTAADGVIGLALLERQTIDAVLVDLTMPRMDGAAVIAVLRERRPGLPIVLCSGYDRDGRGPVVADAYLPKPFRLDALEQTLARLLP